MKLSICIVNYNAKNYLKKCLESIYNNPPKCDFEVVLVDNNSSDASQELVKSHFKQVRLVQNKENRGFIKANNQALKNSKGQYLFVLNNDTIVFKNSIDTLIQFMDDHPKVGTCGPKVLNADKTIQHQCKRGLPSPWNSLAYFLQLDKLFPKSKFFGGYLLTYLNPNQIQEVDSLSGSCMLVRDRVIKEVGYMDEDYYMYADDLDWCYRIKTAGWKIFYIPDSQIVHFGGKGGSTKKLYRNIFEFYRSAYIFHKKNLAQKYLFLINWLVYFGILIKFVSTLIINTIKTEKTVGSKKP